MIENKLPKLDTAEIGDRVFFFFSTTMLPIEAFRLLNTEGQGSYGGVRTVRKTWVVSSLGNIELYIKYPEFRFNTTISQIHKGDIWWGGERSGEKCRYYTGLEAQIMVFYEALLLVKLYELGVNAELPQAVVTNSDSLVLLTLSVRADGNKELRTDWKNVQPMLMKNDIIPRDLGDHNLPRLPSGERVIIDVNRWLCGSLHYIKQPLLTRLLQLNK